MAQDVAVVAGQSWTEKPDGTVWQLQAIVGDRARLARWEPTSSGPPQLLEREVTVAVLEAQAGWRPATPVEVEAARYDVENAKGLTTAVGEPRPSYQEAMRGLREVRQFLLTRGKALVDELTQLAASSEGYISEAFGTRFTAYLCDECGRVVSEGTLLEGADLRSVVTYEEVRMQEGGGARNVLCWGGEGRHQVARPMRHIVARVTADSPAPDALEGG